jgi:hypothetical protein
VDKNVPVDEGGEAAYLLQGNRCIVFYFLIALLEVG